MNRLRDLFRPLRNSRYAFLLTAASRELLDEPGFLPMDAKLDLGHLGKRMGDAPVEVARRLESIESELNNGIARKRRIIEDPSPKQRPESEARNSW